MRRSIIFAGHSVAALSTLVACGGSRANNAPTTGGYGGYEITNGSSSGGASGGGSSSMTGPGSTAGSGGGTGGNTTVTGPGSTAGSGGGTGGNATVTAPGSTAGSGGGTGGNTTVTGACNDLPATGTWQNITPPSLNMGEWCWPQATGCPQAGMTSTYGTLAFVRDPNNPGTIYLGTSTLGLWKSSDCGSTWVKIDTGNNASAIDGGRNWTMLIDPTNSHLYTVAGYGAGGVYKSIDGGVNWTQILTQNILDATGATPCAMSSDPQVCGWSGGFMETLSMDPTNSQHLLASFHSACSGTPLPGAATDSQGGWGCLAESVDAGQTWTLTTSALEWSEGSGQTMVDSKTWFFAGGFYGLWRTTTGGVSIGGAPPWTKVYGGTVNGSVYRASNGLFYTGGDYQVWSADGITWTEMPSSPSNESVNGSTPEVDDGHTLYVAGSNAYYAAPLGSGDLSFTQISSTPFTTNEALAAYLDYDAAHHLLYASNLTGGFWRYATQ